MKNRLRPYIHRAATPGVLRSPRCLHLAGKSVRVSEHFRYGEPVSGIQMSLDDAYIMLTGPRSGTDSPARLGHGTQTLTIIVADVYAHFLTSRREGAVIWEELHVTVYGERQYGVTDLDGHRWLFSEHVQDVDPKDWGAIMKLDDRKL